jgi:hypothetical protein
VEQSIKQVQLSVDEATLAHLRPSASASRIPEDVVRVIQLLATLLGLLATLLQTLAILVAGAWVYYLYATFQRASNHQALAIAAAQLEQAKLSRQQAALELGRLVQTPLAITQQLSVAPLSQMLDEQRLYLANYTYRFTNSGNKPVEVSYIITDAFLAHPPPRPARPIPVNDVTSASPLTWVRFDRRAFNCRDWQPNTGLTTPEGELVPAEHCGAGSGIVKSGETTEGKLSALVYGRPRDLIQFRARCTIDGKTRMDLSDYAPLTQEKPL